MKQIPLLWLIIFLATGVLLTVGCSDDEVADPGNQAPTIQSVSADPDTIVSGELITVSVNATDPEGDELSYEWEVHGSSFMAVFASANMIEVSNCCEITDLTTAWVLALVSDEHDATSRDSVQVWVLPEE